jgi:linoleoyl-CoA desaturase
MNHNAEHCHDVKGRNDSADWGESQLHSSADWGVQLSFLQASRYLWLNYHTVHHLFPRTDFSHHPAIQKILLETCQEFDIKYETADSPWTIYRQMVHAFQTPLSLLQEVSVYGGGL